MRTNVNKDRAREKTIVFVKNLPFNVENKYRKLGSRRRSCESENELLRWWTSPFIPHGEREREIEREEKKKFDFDHWSTAHLPIGYIWTQRKWLGNFPRKEENENKLVGNLPGHKRTKENIWPLSLSRRVTDDHCTYSLSMNESFFDLLIRQQ